MVAPTHAGVKRALTCANPPLRGAPFALALSASPRRRELRLYGVTSTAKIRNSADQEYKASKGPRPESCAIAWESTKKTRVLKKPHGQFYLENVGRRTRRKALTHNIRKITTATYICESSHAEVRWSREQRMEENYNVCFGSYLASKFFKNRERP